MLKAGRSYGATCKAQVYNLCHLHRYTTSATCLYNCIHIRRLSGRSHARWPMGQLFNWSKTLRSSSINQRLASNTCKTRARLLEVDRDLSNILLPWRTKQALLAEDLTSQTHELHSPAKEGEKSNHNKKQANVQRHQKYFPRFSRNKVIHCILPGSSADVWTLNLISIGKIYHSQHFKCWLQMCLKLHLKSLNTHQSPRTDHLPNKF